MEAVLLTLSLKQFTIFLSTLAKIGPELTVECGANRICLSSINQSKSSFGQITLDSTFFSAYSCTLPNAADDDDTEGNGAATASTVNRESDPPAVKFKIAVKPLVSIFRKGLDSVESVKLSYDQVADRMVVVIQCKSGIIKTHSLRLITLNQHFRATIPSDFTYQFTASPKVIHSWLSHFPPKLDEVSLIPLAATLCLTSFKEEGSIRGNATHHRSLTTELMIDFLDLDSIHIPPTGPPTADKGRITFNLRDFKTALFLAEAVHTPVLIQFHVPGSPLIVMSETDEWTFALLLATTEGVVTVAETATQPVADETSSRLSLISTAAVDPATTVMLETDDEGDEMSFPSPQNARVMPSLSPPLPHQTGPFADDNAHGFWDDEDDDLNSLPPSPKRLPRSSLLFSSQQRYLDDTNAIPELLDIVLVRNDDDDDEMAYPPSKLQKTLETQENDMYDIELSQKMAQDVLRGLSEADLDFLDEQDDDESESVRGTPRAPPPARLF